MTTQTGLTIEQFLAADWPPHTQLINGEVVMNDPGFRHGEITVRILVALRYWADFGGGHSRAGSEGNWTLSPGHAYKPDVWWAPDDRRPHPDAIRSDTPPAIVVEVWSPGTSRFDTGRKREIYEQAGAGELWLVSTPHRMATLLRRSAPDAATFDITVDLGPGDAITSPRLDRFSLAVDSLFTD